MATITKFEDLEIWQEARKLAKEIYIISKETDLKTDFRFKDFGVECRALSNFWIHTDEDMAWVWEQTIKAVNCVLDGEADEIINKYSEQAREAINTANLELAEGILMLMENSEKKEQVTT